MYSVRFSQQFPNKYFRAPPSQQIWMNSGFVVDPCGAITSTHGVARQRFWMYTYNPKHRLINLLQMNRNDMPSKGMPRNKFINLGMI